MQKTHWIALSALLSGCLTAQTTGSDYIVSANIALRDGSSVRGEFAAKSIDGSTAFMEKLELDPAIVKSVSFTGTNGESKVELKNGDRFAMTVANDAFAIKSLLGDLKIPRNSFRAIATSNTRVCVNFTFKHVKTAPPVHRGVDSLFRCIPRPRPRASTRGMGMWSSERDHVLNTWSPSMRACEIT